MWSGCGFIPIYVSLLSCFLIFVLYSVVFVAAGFFPSFSLIFLWSTEPVHKLNGENVLRVFLPFLETFFFGGVKERRQIIITLPVLPFPYLENKDENVFLDLSLYWPVFLSADE